jgi:hypothetical protein
LVGEATHNDAALPGRGVELLQATERCGVVRYDQVGLRVDALVAVKRQRRRRWREKERWRKGEKEGKRERDQERRREGKGGWRGSEKVWRW